MMRKLLSHLISATLGLWLAVLFVPGVQVIMQDNSSFFGFHLTALWEIYLLLGIILGLLHFFVKPVLDLITLPLRIITLGLFGFVVSAALIFAVDIMFRELSTPLFWPLFWTTIVMQILNLLLTNSVLKSE